MALIDYQDFVSPNTKLNCIESSLYIPDKKLKIIKNIKFGIAVFLVTFVVFLFAFVFVFFVLLLYVRNSGILFFTVNKISNRYKNYCVDDQLWRVEHSDMLKLGNIFSYFDKVGILSQPCLHNPTWNLLFWNLLDYLSTISNYILSTLWYFFVDDRRFPGR